MQLVLLGLVPLAVLAALAIFNAARVHRDELSRSTQELSRAIATAVEAELDAAVITLTGLTQSPDLQAGNIRSFYDTATNTVRLQTSWAGVALSDGKGHQLFKTTQPYGGSDSRVVDPESMKRAIETGRPVVGALMAGHTERHAVAVRVPLVRQGQVAFVLTAIMMPDRLQEMLERQHVPRGWIIAVLDKDLRIVARSRNHAQFVTNPTTPALQQLVQDGAIEGTGISTSQEGTEVVTAFRRTRDFNWLVAVGASTLPLAGFFNPMLSLYLAGVGGSMLICIWLAVRLGRRITADIGEAARVAAHLGQGAPPAAGFSQIEEIARLGQALHEAGERLARSEAALRAALQEAQAAERTKDEFLAVLGHELRNPLAPMVSAMYLLDARMDASSERERAVLRRQMAHLKRLVDDLLDVSRIARGKVEVRLAPVDLVRLLREVLDDVRQARAVGSSDISLHTQLEQAQVAGDAPRLAQVFTNLLTNALRYGNSRPITLSITAVPEGFCIRVQDQGEGMDPATLARVFEPFYQSPQSLSRPKGGLGLGLAIVRSIVLAHGGTVTARSSGHDQGSRFDVMLPAIATAATEAQP
jgi:signal transduction histidine kinase